MRAAWRCSPRARACRRRRCSAGRSGAGGPDSGAGRGGDRRSGERRDHYLLGRRTGTGSRLAFLDDLAAGRFTVECLEPDQYATVVSLKRRYADLDLGLADAATVVLAARLATHRVLTFDEHHFRSVQPLQGGAFELLPSRHAAGVPG